MYEYNRDRSKTPVAHLLALADGAYFVMHRLLDNDDSLPRGQRLLGRYEYPGLTVKVYTNYSKNGASAAIAQQCASHYAHNVHVFVNPATGGRNG